MRFVLVIVLALLFAGCTSTLPAPDVQTPALAAQQTDHFEWASTAELGDWYMQVDLWFERAASCQPKLAAQGHADSYDAAYTMGWHEGNRTSDHGVSRAVYPSARAGGIGTWTPLGGQYTPSPLNDALPVAVTAAGLYTFYWAAMGVGHTTDLTGVPNTDPVTFRAALSCDTPFTIVGRGVGSALLLNDVVTGDGVTMPLVGGVAKGHVAPPAPMSRAFLHLESSGSTGSLTFTGDAEARSFPFDGPVRVFAVTDLHNVTGIDVDWTGTPTSPGPGGLPFPYFEAVYATYDEVAEFPKSDIFDVSFSTSNDGPGPTAVYVMEVVATQPTTCQYGIDVSGANSEGEMSALYGVYNSTLEMHWVQEAFNGPGVHIENASERYGYQMRGLWSTAIPAGHASFYWAATHPETLAGTLTCSGNVTIASRASSTRAVLPKFYGQGIGADESIVGASTSAVTFDVGQTGLALFTGDSGSVGEVRATWEGGSKEMRGPLDDTQLPATGNLTIEATMAGYASLAHAVLAALQPVDHLPHETVL